VIRDMFVTEHKHLARERNLRKVFSKTLGNSLLTSDGDYWKRHRRMLAPALHMQQVCTYVDIMVQKAQAVSERWRDGQEAEVEKEMDRLTLGIVTSALFNIDSSAHAGTVERTITELQAIGTRQIARLVQLPDWIPTPENVKQRLMSERLRRIIMGEIRERRARGAGATTCSA
jgi:cytochrome P450